MSFAEFTYRLKTNFSHLLKDEPMILPTNSQHYPDNVLPFRQEWYVRADGSPPSGNRAYAIKPNPRDVLEAIEAAKHATGLVEIDDRYFIGTYGHESGCLNEFDIEIATAGDVAGFVSVGPWQIGAEEAARFGFTLADMLDLGKAARCFVQLASANRTALRGYAGLAAGAPDPDYTDSAGNLWLGGTMRFFLGVAHNHGCGFAHQIIAAPSIGLNVGRYAVARESDNIIAHGYGMDCITGGGLWPLASTPPIVSGSRVLSVTTPFMTGEDVRDLQRHLRAVDASLATDGVYGPGTSKVVAGFQNAHNLSSTGICDMPTWTAILAP
jgi:hypothetical protein